VKIKLTVSSNRKAGSTLVASRSQVYYDSQYEALISKCKLQIGCRNKLATNVEPA